MASTKRQVQTEAEPVPELESERAKLDGAESDYPETKSREPRVTLNPFDCKLGPSLRYPSPPLSLSAPFHIQPYPGLRGGSATPVPGLSYGNLHPGLHHFGGYPPPPRYPM